MNIINMYTVYSICKILFFSTVLNVDLFILSFKLFSSTFYLFIYLFQSSFLLFIFTFFTLNNHLPMESEK